MRVPRTPYEVDAPPMLHLAAIRLYDCHTWRVPFQHQRRRQDRYGRVQADCPLVPVPEPWMEPLSRMRLWRAPCLASRAASGYSCPCDAYAVCRHAVPAWNELDTAGSKIPAAASLSLFGASRDEPGRPTDPS